MTSGSFEFVSEVANLCGVAVKKQLAETGI